MKNQIKFGHFVPQFYLRYFAHAQGKRLHCFDKRTSNVFAAPVKRAAGERYFYDVEGQDEQFAEAAFSRLEGTSGEVYKKIADAPLGDVTEHDLKRLAPFVAAQLLRTKAVRDNITLIRNEASDEAARGAPLKGPLGSAVMAAQILKSLDKYEESVRNAIDVTVDLEAKAEAHALLDDLLHRARTELHQGRFPSILARPSSNTDDEDTVKRSHLSALSNSIRLQTTALLAAPWSLVAAPTGEAFWTSDHPVVRVRTNPRSDSSLDASLSMFLPLTPARAIGIYFLNVERPPAPLELSSKRVHEMNRLQLKQCTRHIYANDGDFSAAEQLLADEPELARPYKESFGTLNTKAFE